LAPFGTSQALFIEFFTSSVLLFVWAMSGSYRTNYPTTREYITNPWNPLAMGLTIAAMSMTGARISGGSVNPYSHFSSSIGSGFDASTAWLYYIGPLMGSLFVAFIYWIFYARVSPLQILPSSSRTPITEAHFMRTNYGAPQRVSNMNWQ